MTRLTAGHVKLLADAMAVAYASQSIPTGELYKRVAQDQYYKAREALFEAIDNLAQTNIADQGAAVPPQLPQRGAS